MEIRKTKHQLRLNGITRNNREKVYTFDVYTIEGFNFKEGKLTCLSIKDEQAGLYMFSHRYSILNVDFYCHDLLYLGKADNLQERPFNLKHDKFKDLAKTKCNAICIYQCSDTEDPKSIESNILNYYNFRFNEQENEDDGCKLTTAAED